MRYSGVQASMGGDSFEKVSSSRVLMVGAGGIGCELLKNLVMSGFGEIEVVDLDTIDLSNLNRQFLFQHKHIGKAKAHVARESALGFNPDANILSHHASIYEPQFDIAWFKKFDIVLNALDNLAARRHVNAMCLAANVPLIESGTEGFVGQTTLHMKRLTRCFDCDALPSRKTYPVCTIRSTPSAPIHCIVWAKSYLFTQLFGKAEDEEETMDKEETAENAEELVHLQREKDALKRLRDAAGTPEYGKLVFEKVFINDVKGLLVMEELWKSRRPPTPLSFEPPVQDPSSTVDALEWDRKVWSIAENTKVFLDSLHELAQTVIEKRAEDAEYSMSFDKDELPTLNFVTATANLRAEVYGLEKKSRFEVKEMAGNIIPAVATTNAIIAGLIVMSAIKTWVSTRINPEGLAKPNPNCGVCSINSFSIAINTETATLGDLLEHVQAPPGPNGDGGIGVTGEIAIQEGDRLLYDVEFDDNLDMPLKELGLKHATRVMITNEDDDEPDKNVIITLHLDHRHNMSKSEYILEGDRTLVPRPRPAAVPAVAPVVAEQPVTTVPAKRVADQDMGFDHASKKQKAGEEDVIEIDAEDDALMVID
ncbi:E1 ubiquitin-activating protein uba2 [Thoreauomyces humboldtii]|nr:E1 ubiquitin-activating protein uba2 [Thoreauomyces humboldtii]